MLMTRFPIPNPRLPSFRRLSLPFGTLIPRDRSALPATGLGEAYPSEQPDFLSLPDSVNYH
jgi:hypothetical protein